MDIIMDEKTLEEIRTARLPRYQEIPNVGLYLKQTVKYINDILAPLLHSSVTETMLSNYVKMHLVASPVKKLYNREQIAHLIYIVMAKHVLSLEHVQLMLRMQLATHETGPAYDYFCREFENVLRMTFGLEPSTPGLSQDGGDEKKLLRTMIVTIAQKIYLERSFRVLLSGKLEETESGKK